MSILKIIEAKVAQQWYELKEEAVMDATDLKKIKSVTLRDRVHPTFGTAMYLGIAGSQFKVSGQTAEAIRESGKPIEDIVVDLPSITIAVLDRTENCKDSKMAEQIYRANFAWE